MQVSHPSSTGSCYAATPCGLGVRVETGQKVGGRAFSGHGDGLGADPAVPVLSTEGYFVRL